MRRNWSEPLGSTPGRCANAYCCSCSARAAARRRLRSRGAM